MSKKLPVIFVLNLDFSPERSASLQQQAKKLGLEIQRIAGVNGAGLTEEEIVNAYSPELNKKFYRHGLTRGEIGCYLGHKKIWQKILDENIKCAVILEDDCILETHFPQVLEAISNLENVEFIKLADNQHCPPAQTRPLSSDFMLVNYHRIPNCAIAYSLTPRGAKKLMRRKMIYRPVDIDMQFAREINLHILGLLPYPITHDPKFDSDITKVNGGFHHNRSTAWRNINYRLRIWWHRQVYYSGDLIGTNEHDGDSIN
jgi:glycosyl transferase, family 25